MCASTHPRNSAVYCDLFEWGDEQGDSGGIEGSLKKVLPEGPRMFGWRIYKAEDVHEMLSQCMGSFRVAAKKNKIYLFFSI